MDPDPDPLFKGMNTDSHLKAVLRIREVYPGYLKKPHPDPYVFWPPGSASASVSQGYGSKDPDPYQNVTDSQHYN